MKRPTLKKLQIVVVEGLTAPPELSTKEALVWHRNQSIYATWDELHEKQLLRGDHVLERLQELFFISERTLVEILRTRPEKVVPAKQLGLGL